MSLRRSPARTSAAVVLAAALTLSACGSDDDSSDDATTTSSAPAESDPSTDDATEDATGDPSESPSEDTGDAAADSGTVSAPNAGISFDAPADWQVIDPNQAFGDDPDAIPQELKDAAEAQGASPEQLLQQLKGQTEVVVFGETEGGFASNLNVVGNPTVPTEGQLRSQLEGINATVDSTEEIDTPVGTGIRFSYGLPAAGMTVRADAVVVPTDSGAAVITVSSLDESRSAQVMDDLIPTLKTL